jgi:hypothetical protein
MQAFEPQCRLGERAGGIEPACGLFEGAVYIDA